MKPGEYIDAAKAALSLSTDYQLAQRAKINPAHIYATRQEKRLMPQPLMIEVAKALQMDFGVVYLDLKGQRKSPVPELAKRAAMVMLAVFIGGNTPGDADASVTSNVSRPTLHTAPLLDSTNHSIGIM